MSRGQDGSLADIISKECKILDNASKIQSAARIKAL
jgi:hypothetical protein